MQRDWNRLDMRWMRVGLAFTAADIIGALVWLQGPSNVLAAVGGIMWGAGIALLGAPIVILRRSGGVAAGDAFIDTTRLVTTGLYGVVRHPQYLGWLVLAAAVPFYTQEGVSAALAIAAVGTTAWGMRGIDAWEQEVFGERYAQYARQVPGYNLALGVWRAFTRHGSSS